MNKQMPINWNSRVVYKQEFWDLLYSRSRKLREERNEMNEEWPIYTIELIGDGWIQVWEAKLTIGPSYIDGLSATGTTKEKALSNLRYILDSYEAKVHRDIQRVLLYFPDDESEVE